MKLPKIIYFIASCNPTEEEREEAANITNAKVVFRNASAVPDEEHAIEICDGVEGCVPDAYKKYPSSDVSIDEYKKQVESIQMKVGDVKAPEIKAKQVPSPPWTPNKG